MVLRIVGPETQNSVIGVGRSAQIFGLSGMKSQNLKLETCHFIPE
jgi:hypothetical protein